MAHFSPGKIVLQTVPVTQHRLVQTLIAAASHYICVSLNSQFFLYTQINLLEEKINLCILCTFACAFYGQYLLNL